MTYSVDPYVHLDVGHTSGCASLYSVICVGTFVE